MNMYDMKPLYLKSTRKNQTPVEIIDKCIMFPRLMRRLVCLLGDRVRLDNNKENPWYEDMTNAGITLDMVRQAEDFVNFCLAEDERRYKRYCA